MEKSELRKAYIAKRSSLASETCLIASKGIADHFFKHFGATSFGVLHHYYPILKKKEIDCLIIVNRIVQKNPVLRIAAPRINLDASELQSIEIKPETRFVKNKWGISEPVDSEFIDEVDLDLVLVPLLCFDKTGHRVGYGKGYYDRFLAKCRPDCLKVGLSYFDPVDKIDGIHDKDVSLDVCVTPSKVFEFG